MARERMSGRDGARMAARVAVILLVLAPAFGPLSAATHTGVPYAWAFVGTPAAIAVDVTSDAHGFASFRIEAQSTTRAYDLAFFLIDRDTGKIVGRSQSSDRAGFPTRDCVLSYGHNLIVETAFPRAGNYTLVGIGTGPGTCEIYFRYHDLGGTTWTRANVSFNTVSARLDDFTRTADWETPITTRYAWDEQSARITLNATGRVFGAFYAEWPGACPTTPRGALGVSGPVTATSPDSLTFLNTLPGAYAFTLDGVYGWAPPPVGGEPMCNFGTGRPKVTLFAADVDA